MTADSGCDDSLRPTIYRLACSPCGVPEPPLPWGIPPSDDLDDYCFDTPLPVEAHRTACTSLGASTARHLESALTLHPAMHLARILPRKAHSGQLDIGANYSVTAHRSLLTSYTPFSHHRRLGYPHALPGFWLLSGRRSPRRSI
jgi:hypothetical protein